MENEKFIPFVLKSVNPEDLKDWFVGRLPNEGEAVEMVCTKRSNCSVELHFRVKISKSK